MLKLRKNKKGFTLVELIVVVAIMAVLAGTVAGVVVSTQNKTKNSQANSSAQNLAKAIAELLNQDLQSPTQDYVEVSTTAGDTLGKIVYTTKGKADLLKDLKASYGENSFNELSTAPTTGTTKAGSNKYDFYQDETADKLTVYVVYKPLGGGDIDGYTVEYNGSTFVVASKKA